MGLVQCEENPVLSANFQKFEIKIMKKLYLYYLWVLTGALSLGVFSSCNDKEEITPTPQPTLAEQLNTVYSDELYPANSLELTFGYANNAGLPLPGKNVGLKTNDLQNGTITLQYVVPGEPQVQFDVNLTRDKADTTLFKISSKTSTITTSEGVQFALTGDSYVTPGHMTLGLTNVVFPENSFNKNSKGTNWWALSSKGDAIAITFVCKIGNYQYVNPDDPTDVTDVVVTEENRDPLGLNSALGPMVSMILPLFVRDIQFQETGNIRAVYAPNGMDAMSGGTPTWTYSPDQNLCQFYVKEGTLYLVPNIQQIVAIATAPKETQTKSGLGISEADLMNFFTTIQPWLTDGIPLTINESQDGSVTLTLETEQLLPILKMLPLVKPLLTNLDFGENGAALKPFVTSIINTLSFAVTITETVDLTLKMNPEAIPADLADLN